MQLRKVTERSRPEVQKVEERDSLLEQIRAKVKVMKSPSPTPSLVIVLLAYDVMIVLYCSSSHST